MKYLIMVLLMVFFSNSFCQNYETIKIGNLEIMKKDIVNLESEFGADWYAAKKTCTNLGAGWRLPTKDELNVLYKNKEKIGGFNTGFYWSSSQSKSVDPNDKIGDAYVLFFENGIQTTYFKYGYAQVRPVKTVK
jgi:hypothetical protein